MYPGNFILESFIVFVDFPSRCEAQKSIGISFTLSDSTIPFESAFPVHGKLRFASRNRYLYLKNFQTSFCRFLDNGEV